MADLTHADIVQQASQMIAARDLLAFELDTLQSTDPGTWTDEAFDLMDQSQKLLDWFNSRFANGDL
jgi:hypothetical protein